MAVTRDDRRKFYPDIYSLSLEEVRLAIALAEVNLPALGNEARQGLLLRLAALRERGRQLAEAKKEGK
jgi:hypothetical protein